ncbi:MAG: hypothetical protein KGL53_02625 [Elusimicrobia bacterium]|nr:hypothetical protein [Elusimicrobiota bacterium]
MTKALALLAVLTLPVSAAPALEAVSAGAAAALTRPLHIKAFKAQRNVSLSGSVRLSGSAFVPQGGNFVTVFLNGDVQVSGDGGQVQGSGSVSQSVSLFINPGSNYVSQFVYVNPSVSLYQNGAYVGTTTLSASVLVSGWVNGGWVQLDGSGNASGSAFIQDQAKKR